MEPAGSNSPLSSGLSQLSSFTPENYSPIPRLSLPYLQQITNSNCSPDSSCLETPLNANEVAFDNLGDLLPQLHMIKLSAGSFIPSLRCLGSSLHALRYLYAPHCSIGLIEGVGTMAQLQELYIPFNRVSDLSPLSVLEGLTLLDIECNEVSDRAQITHLALCRSLVRLSIEGNPICEELGKAYGREIASLVPNLVTVDGLCSNSLESIQKVSSSRIVSEKLIITKSLSNITLHIPSPPTVAPSFPRRPKTSLGMRPNSPSLVLSSDRASDMLRLISVIPQRPKTASGDFGRSINPGVLSESLDKLPQDMNHENEESASDLTQGLHSSLCGSLTHSLRAKRHKRKTSTTKLDNICEGLEYFTGKDANCSLPQPANLDSVLEDLQKWRLRFESNTNLLSEMNNEIT